MSDKNYDQREELYKVRCECKSSINPGDCKLHQRKPPITQPLSDSTNKDAQISEQIRVNKKLREQLAEALYVLDVIARRYKYALDEETHAHIRKTLDPALANRRVNDNSKLH